uniref:Uncharacterized protein n=1 Tax=Geladintestivirus 4 TaxID=3233136 RepID=A0AAU8MJ36_9CAUD
MVKVNKTLSSSDKCRRTKLSKKTNDELVSIILRKDDTERKQSKQIENYKKLAVLNEKRIENIKDTLAKQEESNSYLEKTIVANNKVIENLNKEIDNDNKAIKCYADDNEALNKLIITRNHQLNYAIGYIIIATIVMIILLIMM